MSRFHRFLLQISVIALLGVLGGQALYASSNIGAFYEQMLHEGMEYAIDSDSAWDIEKVAKNPADIEFKINEKKAPNFGFSQATFWFRFKLPAAVRQSGDALILQFGYALIDDIQLYIPTKDGSFKVKAIGRNYPFYQRELDTKDLHFVLHEEDLFTDQYYYLKARSTSSNQYPIHLVSLKKFLGDQSEAALAPNLYMGAMAIMFFYNAIFFFVTLDLIYLIYVTFICVAGAQVMSVQGLSYQYLWPNLVYFNKVSVPFLMNMSVAFSSLFSVRSLERMGDYPIQLKILKAIGIAGAVAGFSSFVLPYATAIKIATLLTILISFGLLIAYLRLSFTRYRPAYYFLISIGALLSASIIYSLKAFGILPHNPFTENSPLIGSAMQVSLLTFALADRFRELKARQEKMQAEMIVMQKDNIKKLDELVAEKTANIQSILKTINQGIFTISGNPPTIDPEKSASLVRLFPQANGQSVDPFKTILSGSSLNADQLDLAKAGLQSCLDSDVINYDANAACFPTAFETKDAKSKTHFYEIDWAPIIDDADTVKKMLVAIRDVTLVRELEMDADRKNQEIDLMMQILAIPMERFGRFLAGIRTLFQKAEHIVVTERAYSSDKFRRIYSCLHTIKGNARTYGVTRLSNTVHELEEVVKRLLNEDNAVDTVQLHEGFELLDYVITEIEQVASQKLGRSMVKRSLSVGPEDVETVIEVLEKIEHFPLQRDFSLEVERIRQEMLRIRYESLETALADTFRSLKRLAEQTGKSEPLIDFRDSLEVYLQDEVQDDLIGIFTHLLSNCLDHGLETIEERIAADKVPQGLISIHTRSDELQDLVILVSDDGRGLNLPKLRDRAIAKGLLQPDEQDAHKIADTIFMAGISTADRVTQLSGRGVGMDAVRSLVEKLEGMISIEFRHKHPDINQYAHFLFRVVLPARHFMIASHRSASMSRAS